MSKLKKMCKAAKDGLKTNEDAIIAEVRDAKFICKNCLRAASEKNLICDPKRI